MSIEIYEVTFEEENYILDMFARSEGVLAIAHCLGLPLRIVKEVLRRHKKIDQLDYFAKAEICRKYRHGKSRAELAAAYNTTQHMIARILKDAGISIAPVKKRPLPSIIKASNRVINTIKPADIRKIRDMLQAGIKKDRIASHFGIARSIIDLIPPSYDHL